MTFKMPTLAFVVVLSIATCSLNSGVVDAFASSTCLRSSLANASANANARARTSTTTSTTTSTSTTSQLNFFSGFEMGGTDAVNSDNHDTDDDTMENPLFFASLVTKAIIILLIKTAKDIVNYPPNLLDEYNRGQQMKNQEIAKNNRDATAMHETAALEDYQNPTPLVMASTGATQQEPSLSSDTDEEVYSLDTDTDYDYDYTPLPLELTKTNPFILLAKFVGVLTYKSMHDALYYPALWINNYLYPPKNDDDYYYFY